MKSELILTSSEVEDLAVCVDCAFQECMDCPRNKAKQKLKEAARDKGVCVMATASKCDTCPDMRHGRWVPTKALFMNECEDCSVCGYRTVWGLRYNYCPHCGAKMDI